MTSQEAEAVLGLSGQVGTAEAVQAYSQKLSEWSKRSVLATNAAAKRQAADMLLKLREARDALLPGGLPAQNSRQQRPSVPARRIAVTVAQPAVATVPSAPQAKQGPPTTPASAKPPHVPPSRPPQPSQLPRLTPARSSPPAAPATSTAPDRHFPWDFTTAAAALGLGVLLGLGRVAAKDNSIAGSAKCPPPGQAMTIGAGWKAEGGETAAFLPGQGEGFLVVNSFPVSEVLLDGRSVGWAPFRVGEKVKLAAGAHRLTLKNHSFDPLSTTVVIAEGQTQEVQCWFDEKKIRVLERR